MRIKNVLYSPHEHGLFAQNPKSVPGPLGLRQPQLAGTLQAGHDGGALPRGNLRVDVLRAGDDVVFGAVNERDFKRDPILEPVADADKLHAATDDQDAAVHLALQLVVRWNGKIQHYIK